MRFTKAHKFALLTMAVPALIILFWTLVSLFQEIFTGSTSELGDGEGYATTALILASLTLFPTLALVSARPSGRWTKRIRDNVLGILAIVFLFFGAAPLIAKIANPGISAIDIFIPLLPLGLWIGFATFKELYPGFHVSLFAISMINFVIVVAMLVMLPVGLLLALSAIFPGVKQTPLPSILVLLPPALFLAPPIASAVISRRSQHAALKPVTMCYACIQPGHDWREMAPDEAEQEWEKMHRLPASGLLKRGWTCSHCPVIRLDCEREGESYVLLRGLFKQPWGVWLSGLILRHGPNNGDSSRNSWRLRFHERLEVDWRPMGQETLASEAPKRGAVNGRLPANGWTCDREGVVRFDFTDADGGDMMLIHNINRDESPRACFGLFLLFGRTPTLASDTMNPPWPEQPPASSSPPPKTQPSSS